MKLSVVIPTHNSRELTLRCLASLWLCDPQPDEVIVVDAGWKIEILPGFKVLHHHGGTISESGGSAGSAHPEFMWTDLLRFARNRRGPVGARRSTRALRIGGRLRLLGRRLASPLVAEDHRNHWQAETSIYVDALRALDELSASNHN